MTNVKNKTNFFVRLIKILFYELVYGGHLLSLGALSIVLAVVIVQGVKPEYPLLVIAYLTSQIVYSHDHLSDFGNKNNGNSERLAYLSKTYTAQKYMWYLYIAVFVIFNLTTNLKVFSLSSVIVLGGVLYTEILKRKLNWFVGMKNVYIAFFWSLLSFLVPFYYDLDFKYSFYGAIFLFIFFRWIVNSTFFDIKDIKEDKKLGIKTLPIVFGLSNTLIYLHFINFLSELVLLIFLWLRILPGFTVLLMLFPLYSFFYLYKADEFTEKQLKKISYIVVDGEYLFWPIALLAGMLLIM